MLGKWLFCSLLILLLSDISVVLCNDTRKQGPNLVEILPVEEIKDAEPMLVNGMLYKTFKKYNCRLFDNIERRRTLLYGNQGWTFPRQDVNLTFVYPSADLEARIDGDFLITGYQVILFADGSEGNAYIGTGGMLEDNISLTFISKDITTLSYQFWLYGAERHRITTSDRNLMC